MSTNMQNYSFKRGYNNLPRKYLKEVREEITNALGLTRESFYRRLRGEVEPKVSEAKKIEEIFNRYNISNIWGDK